MSAHIRVSTSFSKLGEAACGVHLYLSPVALQFLGNPTYVSISGTIREGFTLAPSTSKSDYTVSFAGKSTIGFVSRGWEFTGMPKSIMARTVAPIDMSASLAQGQIIVAPMSEDRFKSFLTDKPSQMALTRRANRAKRARAEGIRRHFAKQARAKVVPVTAAPKPLRFVAKTGNKVTLTTGSVDLGILRQAMTVINNAVKTGAARLAKVEGGEYRLVIE